MATLNEQEADIGMFREHYAKMLCNMLHLDMTTQVEDWYSSVATKFGKPIDELIIEEFYNDKQIELLHHILARGEEATTSYFGALLSKLDTEHDKLNNISKFRLKEIVNLC